MLLLWCLIGYVSVSIILYVLMDLKCKKNPVFKAPSSKVTFYVLAFTWGLPTVAFGLLVGLILILCGRRPKRYGWEWCFEFESIGWGLELGVLFIAPRDPMGEEDVHMHEHGHGIQNIYLGIFNPLVVFIPSVVRFWYREFRDLIGKPCTTDYSDIWFEKSADESGKALIERLDLEKYS